MAEAQASIGSTSQGAEASAGSMALPVDGSGRAVLFFLAFLFFWMTVDPFEDLTTEASGDPRIGANLLSQVLIVLLSGFAALAVRRTPVPVLRSLLSPWLVILIGWIALSVVTAVYPDLAGRRLILALLIMLLAAATLLLPQSVSQFNIWLAGAAIFVLVCSYLGVLLIPHRAIHQITEVAEPQHAGSWRGPYLHKNITGGAMALLLVVGIHIARSTHRGIGIAIAIGSGVFTLMSQAKTSIALLPVALALTAVLLWLRNTPLRLFMIASLLGGFNLLTVGSSVIPQLKPIVSMITSDPTFTNRTDVWQLVIGEIADRPLTGFGFQAYWGTDALYHRGSVEGWANKASHAHNAFLDIAVTSGIPAAFLAIVWLVVVPVLDLRRSEMRGGSRTLDGLYIGIWMFTLLCASLEATLFIGAGGGPMWFMMLIAVFGLRLQANARLVSDPLATASPARANDRLEGEPLRPATR